ncbi:hypothetical protein Z950_1310 [Sulfitobacter mediterraneus KCTC 32188]|nr:hypothetical protein Z950_1310 [Sulfitobacter mediterraneus KCTC 32188]
MASQPTSWQCRPKLSDVGYESFYTLPNGVQLAKSAILQRPNRPVLPKANLRFDGAGAVAL